MGKVSDSCIVWQQLGVNGRLMEARDAQILVLIPIDVHIIHPCFIELLYSMFVGTIEGRIG
jgi:hypothetical protein